MKSAIGLFILLVLPVTAGEVTEPASLLKLGGQRTWALPIHGQAVGFSLPYARRVNISARLGNGGGHAYADAFLMRRIGPGTTEKDEVGRIPFDLAYPYEGWVDLFTNIELDAGTYWLVIARPYDVAFSSINWYVAQPPAMTGSCFVSYLDTKAYTFRGDAAEYTPASKFEKKFEPYAFEFEVWEMRPVGSQPPCDGSS